MSKDQMDSETQAQSRPKRSRGSCATCRRRHVRCDKTRPVCNTCSKAGVGCEGFTADVRWAAPSGQAAATCNANLNTGGSVSISSQRSRRHLYTETSRQVMSHGLVASLETNSVDGCLAELDRTKASQATVGPFGVLDLGQTESGAASQAAAPQAEPKTASENPFPEPDTTSPLSLDTLLGLDNTLQWGDLFDVNPAYLFAADPGRLTLDGHGLPESTWTWPESTQTPVQMVDGVGQHTQGSGCSNPEVTGVPPTVPAAQSPAASDDDAVVTPDVAQFLLRHFRANLSCITRALPTGLKSPWEILNLSFAVQTFADLSFLEAQHVSHAAQANYWAVLSCAAYHANATPASRTGSSLENLASTSLTKAKGHMQMSLRTEVHGKHRAKYKDQLMAILMLTNNSIIMGNERDARCYLLDAERLLRLRGLSKRHVSRRVRLLHHVYTWLRIMGESAYVIHDYDTYEPTMERPIAQAQHDPLLASGVQQPQEPQYGRLDDFLRLQPHASDSDLEIEELKEYETGRRDIHLEDSREYADTQFPQVYGVPETWLSLVSQVTRLANLLDAVKSRPNPSSFDLSNSLQKRAKLLEEMICSFAARPTLSHGGHALDQDTHQQPAVTDEPNTYMLRALNTALEIFFYRRIRDLNPRILQGYVSDVIDSLRGFEKALVSHNLEGPCPVWPLFMAGCEAIRPDDREFFLALIQRGVEQFGISSLKTAGAIMSNVWERRDRPVKDLTSPDDSRIGTLSRHSAKLRSASLQWTWVDALRESKTTLFLC